MPQTLQPLKRKANSLKACRVSRYGSQERILKFSSLMPEIIKYIHLLCQNLALFFLPHSCNARMKLGLWESKWTKADNIQHGAVFDSCLLCLFVWKLFVLGFLENAFIQQGIFMIQVVFISRDPPIRENLFCPQIKYVSNTIMSALHSPTILPLFIKDIDPDQMFLPPATPSPPYTSPSSASHAVRNEHPQEKIILCSWSQLQ